MHAPKQHRHAQARAPHSFPDVPPTHPAYEAIEFLRGEGILQGESDGTFKPEQLVTRAEAKRMFVAPPVEGGALGTEQPAALTKPAAGRWLARVVQVVAWCLYGLGGRRPVTLAEVLILMLRAYEADVGAFDDVRQPLATDVADPTRSYYPYLRAALAYSLLQIEPDGRLHPERALTRGEMAQLVFRFHMYQEGRRMQALLAEAATEFRNVLCFLTQQDVSLAEQASARAILASLGAREIHGATAMVQATVQAAAAFRLLVRASRARAAGGTQEAVALAEEAWRGAEEVKLHRPDFQDLLPQLQAIARQIEAQREQRGERAASGQTGERDRRDPRQR